MRKKAGHRIGLFLRRDAFNIHSTTDNGDLKHLDRLSVAGGIVGVRSEIIALIRFE